MKLQVVSLKKINENDRPLARLTKKERRHELLTSRMKLEMSMQTLQT